METEKYIDNELEKIELALKDFDFDKANSIIKNLIVMIKDIKSKDYQRS